MKRIQVPSRAAGICGVVSPLVAFGAIGASILLHDWFSWADNALSDLGALGTSYNLVFNLGLIVAGVLGVIFSLGLPKLIDEKVGVSGVIIFGVGMISLTLIGVFPSGTEPHEFVSIAFYALTTLALTIIGVDQLRGSSDRVWGIFVLSIIALALASIALINTIPRNLGAAIPEVIGALVISEFSIIFGIRLLKIS